MKIKLDEKLPVTNFFYLDKEDNVKKIKSDEIYQNESLIIIGVPGAFTKVCSAKHLPGYVSNYGEAKKKVLDNIFENKHPISKIIPQIYHILN